MPTHSIEIILCRQLADCLNVPVFIVNPEGTLIFYNVPAEGLLGKKFEATGPMPVSDWGTSFFPHDGDGNDIPPEDLPLVQTLQNKVPAHKTFWIKSLDGKSNKISVTSIPVIGRTKAFSGAMAIFWDNQVKE